MSPRIPIVALVGAGCIAAAGVGGYLAVRSGSAAPSAAPAALTEAAPEPESPAAAEPVSARNVAPEPAPVQSAAPVRSSRASQSRPVPQVARAEPRPASTPVASPKPSTFDDPFGAADAEPAAVATSTAAPAVISASQPVVIGEPRPVVDEITVPESSVIGIRFESAVSSETARVEDAVSSRVTRDVLVDGRTAIPAGATLEGVVSLVDRGGSFKERARIGVRFTSMVLPDKTRVPIRTEAIYREGEAPGGEATSKIGASAVVGAVLGAVIGGKKGAAIGGTAGAAGGTAMVVAGGPNAATIPAGTPLTVRLSAPVSVSVPHVEP